MVDDEPMACKWFQRLYGDEFVVLTAGGVDEALDVLARRAPDVGVLLTDFRMPVRDGVELLGLVRHRHEHVSRLLASAYADKSVALAAVNEGQVEHILEKPLDEQQTRKALRRALAGSVRRVQDRTLAAHRAAALRDTLGFLAHEVTSPLATVRGYLGSLTERHLFEGDPAEAHFAQDRPGQVLHMIEAARRRADYAQSLVSTFLNSARDACFGEDVGRPMASVLLDDVLRTYPFDEGDAGCVALERRTDFALPGRRDLLYLVVCTLIKNALQALHEAGVSVPAITLSLDERAPGTGEAPLPCLTVSDNGPGVDPQILPHLGREPVTTRAERGGTGMGLLFCHRVMVSVAGTLKIESRPGAGTQVMLFFPADGPDAGARSQQQESP
ncbi:MAG: hybrid sensor histidine kinase/response regulator [Burkholderiaceae bacterium]